MVAGVIGHHGNHVIQLVAGDTDHVFEHAPIRGPNGTDWIATEVVFLTEAVMCTVVQVWISLLLYFIFPSFGPKFKPSNLLLPGFLPSFPQFNFLIANRSAFWPLEFLKIPNSLKTLCIFNLSILTLKSLIGEVVNWYYYYMYILKGRTYRLCILVSFSDYEKSETHSEPFSKRSSLPLVGLWLGISLVVLLCLSGILWITLRFSRKRR